MVGDMSIVTARDMHVIEIVTALLVLIILLVIYRRPVTVLLPLITIGISVTSAQGVVSGLAQLGLGVSALTIALMTAMIFGAGTDYAVFLISRYHEYIRSGIDSDLAVQKALSSIGEVIAGSAATVAVTFLGMVFTRLPAFTSIGPALAVSIGIAFLAAVTLLPAILVLAGRRGWVTPRPALTGRLWQRSAVQLVRRPKAHLLVSLSVLIGAGRLRGLPPAHLQRPPAVAAIGAEQRRLFDDGRTTFRRARCCRSTSTSTRRTTCGHRGPWPTWTRWRNAYLSCPISLRCAASRDLTASRSIRPSSAFKPERSAASSKTPRHRSATEPTTSTR